MKRLSLLGGIATAALVAAISQPARAQDTAANAERGEPVIVVTAQKRVENVQDVPISISVVSGDKLVDQGSSSLTDYAGYVPGLTVDSGGTPGLSTVTLRGIAPTAFSSAVGYYLDEAPVGPSGPYARGNLLSLDLLPYDIQRIEVLRGPQGTLYGASSIGGLLKYVPVDPSLSRLQVRGGGELFTIDHAGDLGWAAQALANVPVVQDRLGVTGSFAYRNTPGWVDSTNNAAFTDQNGYEQTGGRVSALFRPADEFTIKLSALWQSVDSDSRGVYAADLSGRRLGNGRSNNNYVREPFNSDFGFYSGVVTYDFGPAELKSVSSYSEMNSKQDLDYSLVFGTFFPVLSGGAIPAGIAPLTYRVNLDKFTQEVRLSSTGNGTFSWLIGGFYTHEKTLQTQLVRSFDMAGTAIPALDPLAEVSLPAVYEEYAAFGNATLRLGDRFEVTGGVRWAHNRQHFRQISSGAIVPPADDPGRSSESNFTFSVSPQYNLGDNAMIYARVATGYRPGGPNVFVPGLPPSVDSDKVTNYEVGVKADIADRLATVDLAAFYMDWKDIQVVQVFGGIGGLVNGGKAVSKGVEGSLTVRPATGLSLAFTAAYTDATLSEDIPAVSGVDGDRLPNVPKFSGSARIDYEATVNGDDRIQLGMGVSHSNSRLSRMESDPLMARARPYTSVDLNAGYTFDDRWTLRLYARNLFNDDGEFNRITTTDAANQPVFNTVTPLQPRTVGLAFELAI